MHKQVSYQDKPNWILRHQIGEILRIFQKHMHEKQSS